MLIRPDCVALCWTSLLYLNVISAATNNSSKNPSVSCHQQNTRCDCDDSARRTPSASLSAGGIALAPTRKLSLYWTICASSYKYQQCRLSWCPLWSTGRADLARERRCDHSTETGSLIYTQTRLLQRLTFVVDDNVVDACVVGGVHACRHDRLHPFSLSRQQRSEPS